MASPKAVASGVNELAQAFINTKLPESKTDIDAMLNTWHRHLADVEDIHLHAAVAEWIETERWFPTIADLRSNALARQFGLPGENEAWALAVTMVNSRDAAVYTNTHIAVRSAVRDAGGPKAFSECSDMGKLRQSFLGAYRARVRDVYKNPKSAMLAINEHSHTAREVQW